MKEGAFIGKPRQSPWSLSGTYVERSGFIVANNTATAFTPDGGPATSSLQSRLSSSYGNQITVGSTGQAGRVDFARGSDGQVLSWVGYMSAGSWLRSVFIILSEAPPLSRWTRTTRRERSRCGSMALNF